MVYWSVLCSILRFILLLAHPILKAWMKYCDQIQASSVFSEVTVSSFIEGWWIPHRWPSSTVILIQLTCINRAVCRLLNSSSCKQGVWDITLPDARSSALKATGVVLCYTKMRQLLIIQMFISPVEGGSLVAL